jgi:hypothetical protein
MIERGGRVVGVDDGKNKNQTIEKIQTANERQPIGSESENKDENEKPRNQEEVSL